MTCSKSASVLKFALALSLSLAAPLGAQTAKQGAQAVPPEAKASQSPLVVEEFHSPMVIHTVIAPLLHPTLWRRLDGSRKAKWKDGEWLSLAEYHDLGRFTCDGISIRGDDGAEEGSWESGLRVAARELGDAKTELKFRVSISNPGNVNDKLVTLVFEVVNGDGMLALASMTVKSRTSMRHRVTNTGGDDETKLVIDRVRLMSDPPPILRITVSTRDY